MSNGDTLLDFNLYKLRANYNFNQLFKVVLLKINKKLENKRFGEFKINSKKKTKNIEHLINSGFFIINKKILSLINKKDDKDFERDLLSKIKINQNNFIKVNFDNTKFIDIGVPKDFKRAHKFLEKFYFKPAIFFDRDGVVNHDDGYTYKYKDIRYINNIKKALNYLIEKNYFTFVISNQSGVGRGFYQTKDVINLHQKMNNDFRSNFGHIDEFVFATYYKFSKKKKFRLGKNMRKPNTGMIKYLLNKWDIDLKKSLIIGDKNVDKQLAARAGIKFLYVKKEVDLIKNIKSCLKLT